jgi:hypothetical protein
MFTLSLLILVFHQPIRRYYNRRLVPHSRYRVKARLSPQDFLQVHSTSFHKKTPQGHSQLTTEGHPLHKAFTYTKLTISELLSLPSSIPFTSLLSTTQSPTPDPLQSSTYTTSSTIPKVLVIDCTDSSQTRFPRRPMPSPHAGVGTRRRDLGSDLEVLARGLCAERGWNALVSRRGRGCLACAIREAGALRWRVVIRIA